MMGKVAAVWIVGSLEHGLGRKALVPGSIFSHRFPRIHRHYRGRQGPGEFNIVPRQPHGHSHAHENFKMRMALLRLLLIKVFRDDKFTDLDNRTVPNDMRPALPAMSREIGPLLDQDLSRLTG